MTLEEERDGFGGLMHGAFVAVARCWYEILSLYRLMKKCPSRDLRRRERGLLPSLGRRFCLALLHASIDCR